MKYLKFTPYLFIFVIIFVAIWFFGFKSDVEVVHNGAAPKAIDEAVVGTKKETTGKDRLESLFALASSSECTFSFSENNIKGEGSLFVDNGSVRVDALYSQGENMPTASYMIFDVSSGLANIWFLIGEKEIGFENNIDKLNATLMLDNRDMHYPLPSTIVQYSCRPWTLVDGSVFVVPKDISFTKI